MSLFEHRQPADRRGPHRCRRLAVRGGRRRLAVSPARRCRPWTRPASRPRSTSPARPARLIGTEGEGWRALAKTLDLAAVALAAEQVGGAQKCLEMAVEYAKVRVQFGRPIGIFQAIKHKCADMLLEVESAKSAAYYAGLGRRRGQRRAAGRGLAWPRPTAPTPTSTPPPRTSRSTAASASPGSTTPTCTSSGPSPPSSSSATPPTTASCSPSASASNRRLAFVRPTATRPRRPRNALGA